MSKYEPGPAIISGLQGVLGEAFPAEVRANQWQSGWNEEVKPCPHAEDIESRDDGLRTIWRVPLVLVLRNQNGYDATAICLECAAGLLDEARRVRTR